MKTLKKRLIALLCLVLCLESLPTMASASSWHGEDFADGLLAERLETVIQYGVSGCVTPSLPAVGSRLDKNTVYRTTYTDGSSASSDYQCAAYARAVYSYLFGHNLATNKYRERFLDVNANVNHLSYDEFASWGVKCGAYLRTTANANGSFSGAYGHSLLILGYDSNTVITLEGNYGGNGEIGIRTYTWSDFNKYLFVNKVVGKRSNGTYIYGSRYVCSLTQPLASIYESLGDGATGSGYSSSSNTETVADGVYYIEAYCGKVVEVEDSRMGSGANVQIWAKSGRNLGCQKFRITKSGNYYTLAAVHSGKMIDVSGGCSDSGTNLWQYTPNGTAAQMWQFEDAGNGYFFIRSALGTYMDVEGGGTGNGNNVWAYSFNGSHAQMFRLVPAA